MTIICALHDPNAKCTWIGSDSLVTIGHTCLPYVDKWVSHNGWAVGVAGSLRAVNLVQNNADQLFHDLERAFDFSNRLKELFVEDGFNCDTAEGPKDYGQLAILANGSGVWAIGPCFEMFAIPPGELFAEGSGRRYAFGVGHALQAFDAIDHVMLDIVRVAVGAAIRYDDGCGGEPRIEKLCPK